MSQDSNPDIPYKIRAILAVMDHHSRNVSQHYLTTHNLYHKTLPILRPGNNTKEIIEIMDRIRSANKAAEVSVRNMREIVKSMNQNTLEHLYLGLDPGARPFHFSLALHDQYGDKPDVLKQETADTREELEERLRVEEKQVREMEKWEKELNKELIERIGKSGE